jgi:hypothetical protein
MFQFRKRTYIVGNFARMQVYTEYGQLVAGGILAPPSAPTLSAGTGSSGSLGLAIGYITFLHKQGQQVMQESNPSAPSETFELQGNGRTWSDIPTTATDSRVTHVRGYVSVDGALPKMVWERQLGVSSVTENVLTSALGDLTLPLQVGLDGESDVDVFARGVLPYCKFGAMYHNSAYYAGDPLHPDRIYKSRINEPESVNAIQSIDDADSGYLETLDGEAVTGLKRWNDLLLVTCLRCVYAIQGFDAGDLQIIKISNFYGCVSNAALANVGPEGDVWGPGQDCIWRYDGTFHDLTYDDLRDFWRDNYRENPDLFQLECFAAEDRVTSTYKLQVPLPSAAPVGVNSFKWIGHYEPVINGELPWWVFDYRGRSDSIMGLLLAGNSSTFLESYTGSCDGKVRKENVASDGDDDGDTYGKRLRLLTKHFFFGDQGGDWAHGRNYQALDIFLKNSNNAVTVSAWAGDDTASEEALAPQWTRTISASAVTLPRSKVALTSISFNGLTEINGKGIALEFVAQAHVGVALRGFTIYHSIGEQERPFSS